jgi:hypothetical protein
MKATICISSTLFMVFAGTLPAADSRLAGLVMPNATVIAGLNVTQAKTSPFGQYVLTMMSPHDQQLQALATLTGFDPRQDVSELLLATSGGKGPATGLVLARGTFNVGTLTAAAALAGATTEIYKDIAIVEMPKASQGAAFLDATLAILGDVASIKGAIDRQSPSAQHLGAGLIAQIGQLSGANDAWVLTTVSPASLTLPSAAPTVPGLNLPALQQIQQASAAVRFGASVTVTAQARLDTPQNATTLAGMLQLLANMAQMQAQKAPQAAALAQSLTFSADGTSVSASFSLPEAQMQQLMQSRQQEHKASKVGLKKMQ